MSGFEHVTSVWAGWLPPRVPGMLVLPLILPPPPTLATRSVTQRLLRTSERLLFFFFLGLEPQSGDVVTRRLPFITFPFGTCRSSPFQGSTQMGSLPKPPT